MRFISLIVTADMIVGLIIVVMVQLVMLVNVLLMKVAYLLPLALALVPAPLSRQLLPLQHDYNPFALLLLLLIPPLPLPFLP